MKRKTIVAALALASVFLSACTSATVSEPEESTGPSPSRLESAQNVVLLLADDLDWETFNAVPELAELRKQGTTFINHTVTDSLCCPSRASILTGKYIHTHKVVSNVQQTGGGWPTFNKLGHENNCLPVWLNDENISTGMFGKYLNQYPYPKKNNTYVPPGWNEWNVPVSRGVSYTGYNYKLNSNGTITKYGSSPEDFLENVLANKATSYISSNDDTRKFLFFSSFLPHDPSPASPAREGTSYSIPSINQSVGVNPPTWRKNRTPATGKKLAALSARKEARQKSAASFADSVTQIMEAVKSSGEYENTVFIITSDNGYHSGEKSMGYGKRSPYKQDSVVPLVIIGGGFSPGAKVNEMTSTIDLAPTVMEMFGLPAASGAEGRSLLPLRHSGSSWRTGTLTESLAVSKPGDPDYQPFDPPKFSALRTQEWLYVIYDGGEEELYNLKRDPEETRNIAASAPQETLTALRGQLAALSGCYAAGCRVADMMPPPQ